MHRLNPERALAVLDSEWMSGNVRTARVLTLATARLETDGTKRDGNG